jgi:radical SAM protein with 4Fe4S-binding SPASM domain
MSLEARTGPAVIWIDLTSRCPLRCVFCSRENLRGEGEHMNLAMFESVLSSLDGPEIIRLNYSGESANYPWLIEAITETKTLTRAHVEMVTSLVSMPIGTIHRLAGSGIDRVSISLHSLDQKRFPILYGGGSLDSFEQRLKCLLQAVREQSRPPAIDFAVVAMHSNVTELPAIASLAAKSGASSLSIHPVIRRPGVPPRFDIEAGEEGRLTEAFQSALNSNVKAARDANPGVRVSVARPPDAGQHCGAFTCEQNPFETVHVLSNGDVVPCEVMDRKSIGSLRSSTLGDIWRGPAYNEFRDRYARNEIPECANCIFRTPITETGAVRASWGWHERDEGGTLWSRTTSSFECDGNGQTSLVLSGLLPSGPQSNSVEFLRDGQRIAFVQNKSVRSLPFRVELRLDDSAQVNRFVARVEHGFSPWRRGLSNDTRELGFALFSAELTEKAPALRPRATTRLATASALNLKGKSADFLFSVLGPLQRIAAARAALPPVPCRPLPDDSLGVIVPERGSATILALCLAALETALARVSIRAQVAIVINGSRRADYAALIARYPDFRFIFVSRPLGFTAAIRTGLRHITAGWTYLLNNDMWLAEDALSNILRHRGPTVFSLASRINMTNKDAARETNRTGIEFIDGLANLLELDGAATGPLEHFYSGGGSSLFQTEWLRQFANRTTCYDPFYWEDAEWGVWAKAAGLVNIFIPESSVQHVGKATISRFYTASEVSRIFERNRIQFQLRCIPNGSTSAIRERLVHAPRQTIRELLQPLRVASMARTRSIFASQS